MTLAWIVTPCLQPDKKIAGPFRDYEEARRKCVQLVSQEGKLDAATHSRVPNCYVPRAIKLPVNTRNVPSSHPVHNTQNRRTSQDGGGAQKSDTSQSRTDNREPDTGHDQIVTQMSRSHSVLPERFHQLQRKQLLYIAAECDIDVGSAHTRGEIIAAIQQGLEK